jgi:molybdopterin converting factor subunit 1
MEHRASGGERTVKVLFFSILRERTGVRELNLEVGHPMPARQFLDLICEEMPVVLEWRSSLSLAVNRRYAGPDTIVEPGDEVALITPVSGG